MVNCYLFICKNINRFTQYWYIIPHKRAPKEDTGGLKPGTIASAFWWAIIEEWSSRAPVFAWRLAPLMDQNFWNGTEVYLKVLLVPHIWSGSGSSQQRAAALQHLILGQKPEKGAEVRDFHTVPVVFCLMWLSLMWLISKYFLPSPRMSGRTCRHRG